MWMSYHTYIHICSYNNNIYMYLLCIASKGRKSRERTYGFIITPFVRALRGGRDVNPTRPDSNVKIAVSVLYAVKTVCVCVCTRSCMGETGIHNKIIIWLGIDSYVFVARSEDYFIYVSTVCTHVGMPDFSILYCARETNFSPNTQIALHLYIHLQSESGGREVPLSVRLGEIDYC